MQKTRSFDLLHSSTQKVSNFQNVYFSCEIHFSLKTTWNENIFLFFFGALLLVSRAVIRYKFLPSRALSYIGFPSPHSGKPDCLFIPLHHLLHVDKIISPMVNQNDELIWADLWFWSRIGKYEICCWENCQKSQSLGLFSKISSHENNVYVDAIHFKLSLTWHINGIWDVLYKRGREKENVYP